MAEGGDSGGSAGGTAGPRAATDRAGPSPGPCGEADGDGRAAAGPAGPRAWAILLGLSLGVAVSNGFARFAYGLILPAMREDLGWSYTEAGWINTANALGYIVGSLAVFALVSRVRAERLFVGGLLAASLSLVASGLTADFLLLTLWRVVAGIGGALAFVAGGSLAAALFRDDASRSALAVALYFGGGGIGLALGGATLPALFARLGASAWPEAWIGLGLASLVLTGVSALAATALSAPPPPAGRLLGAPLPVKAMAALLLGYAGFATGYIVYMTFLVAFMATLPAGPALVSAVWIVVGIGAIVSPVLWRPVLARLSGGAPLAIANSMLAAGTLLPVLAPTAAGLFLSAAVFGLALFIAPATVTAFARRNLAPAQWGPAIGLYTLVLSLFQTVGPVAGGAIGDAFGGIDAGLVVAGAILALGAVAAARQRPLPPDGSGRT